MPWHDDRLAAEVDLLELEAELELIRLDRLAGRAPRGVRRAMFDHEHAAGVNFAELETVVDARAERVARRLVEDRARFAELLRADLEQVIAAAAHLPADQVVAGRLENLLDPSRFAEPVAGAAELVDAAERFHADELGQAVREGIDRAVDEARAQGIPAPQVPGVDAGQAARLNASARRLAAAPHAEVVAAARDAAHQAVGLNVDPATMLEITDDAAGELSDARLTSNYARPAVQQAHNIGHQEGAGAVPLVATIYASELLDRNTCGPCSLIDGHEYSSEEAALVDYPAGTYIACEGGDRCRGTLVYVWSTEERPTLQHPGDRPPPPEPPQPYPYGSTRPFDPRPPAAPAPTVPSPPPAPAPEPGIPEPTTVPAERVELEPLDDLLPDAPVEADFTDDDLARARRALPAARAEIRAAAQVAQEEARAILDSLDAIKLDQPPKRTVIHRDPGSGRIERRAEHSGGWDWFGGLDEREQVRIRRNWVYKDAEAHGSAPDEIAQRWAARFGTDSTDDAMREWLELNRRVDANGALARGRLPNPRLYGGTDVNSLAASPYNLEILFGNDLELAARHVAAVTRDLEARYAERAFVPARLGPAPYTMTEDEFVAELAQLEDAMADIAPLGEWETYSADAQRTIDRLNELVPYGVDDPDAPMAADELYHVIRRLAERAGLT